MIDMNTDQTARGPAVGWSCDRLRREADVTAGDAASQRHHTARRRVSQGLVYSRSSMLRQVGTNSLRALLRPFRVGAMS